MITKIFTVCLGVVVAAVATVTETQAGSIISGTTATASTEAPFGSNFAAGTVDPTDLNGSNEHVAAAFGAGGNWLSADSGLSSDQWIFVDLGGTFNLEEVRLWNYHEDAGTFETSGRGVSSYSLWVAGAGATLPAGTSASPFTVANGWTQVSSGTLTPGPSTIAPVADLAATDVFNVLGQNGIQYVGLDVDGRIGADPFTAGITTGVAQIQVSEVPEPASVLLALGLAFGGLVMRRRRTRA